VSRAAIGLAAAAALLAGAAAFAQPRPVVGLVLGGGGARGAAHVGVLEVLEELRVPVDCVAGTSMGALVAGAWAAGLSPKEMRAALAGADWADMFIDSPDYAERNFRARRLDERFLPGSELGVGPTGVEAPGGVVGGQKIKLFLNQLVRAERGERDLGALPVPVSIVATDIGTGERIVLREGPLALAMHASMSVPGLIAPVLLNQRKLVDGGLVDNVPVREVRERCGAEVVIAVNVGSGLLPPQEVGSLLSVSAQMVNILTEQNVALSLATLKPTDLLVRPKLDGLTSADFARHAEAADRGREAALALRERLAVLSVPEARWAAWNTLRAGPAAGPQRRIDTIEVGGLGFVNPDSVRARIGQPLGQALDAPALERDLLRAHGDGHFQGLDYTLRTVQDKNVLKIVPIEKPWGPDYLRFSLGVNSNLRQGSSYSLRGAVQRTWLNRLGGELLLTGEIGSTSGLGAEWLQPVEPGGAWFVDASLAWQRARADLYVDDRRLAQYVVRTALAEVAAGLNLGHLGQVRFGWRHAEREWSLETGLPIFPTPRGRAAGPFAALQFEQLNRLYFPSRGWSAKLIVAGAAADDTFAAYRRADAELRVAVPAAVWVFAGRLAATGALGGELPATDPATLGGFQNLSAFAPGQLLGRSTGYAQVRAERIVGRLPLGLNGDMRIGLALEAGRVGGPFSEPRRTGWLDSTAVYLGGETPIGPVFVGAAYSTQGTTNVYLFIGIP
jgi:NTE family protein